MLVSCRRLTDGLARLRGRSVVVGALLLVRDWLLEAVCFCIWTSFSATVKETCGSLIPVCGAIVRPAPVPALPVDLGTSSSTVSCAGRAVQEPPAIQSCSVRSISTSLSWMLTECRSVCSVEGPGLSGTLLTTAGTGSKIASTLRPLITSGLPNSSWLQDTCCISSSQKALSSVEDSLSLVLLLVGVSTTLCELMREALMSQSASESGRGGCGF